MSKYTSHYYDLRVLFSKRARSASNSENDGRSAGSGAIIRGRSDCKKAATLRSLARSTMRGKIQALPAASKTCMRASKGAHLRVLDAPRRRASFLDVRPSPRAEEAAARARRVGDAGAQLGRALGPREVLGAVAAGAHAGLGPGERAEGPVEVCGLVRDIFRPL